MNRRWLLGSLLIAGGVGLVAAATRRPKIGPETRLWVFGDSLAVGLIPQLRALADEEGIADFGGRGIVGSRLSDWDHDAALPGEFAAFQPTLILVSLGTNDEALGPGAAERQAPHLERLLETLAGTGAEVVWVGPPELPFEREGVSDMIRAAVPYYYPSERLSIPRGPDDLHPNAAGYAGWAGALWQWLS